MTARLYALWALLFLSLATVVFSFSAAAEWSELTERRALSQLAEALNTSDSIEVHPLTRLQSRADGPIFQTKRFPEPYVRGTPFRLDQAQTREFCTVFRNMRFVTDTGALCHDPGYLLLFKRDNETLLQATLCLHCSNFELEPLPFSPVWLSFLDQPKGRLPDQDTLARLLTPSEG